MRLCKVWPGTVAETTEKEDSPRIVELALEGGETQYIPVEQQFPAAYTTLLQGKLLRNE